MSDSSKQTAPDKREFAVVVGATGDFGTAIVQRLLAEKLRVVAVARTAANLEALRAKFPAIIPCVADISSDEAIASIAACLDGQGAGAVRLVVHGPGVPVVGGVLKASTSDVLAAVNIKVLGMMRLARAVDSRLVASSRLVAIGGHYGLEPTAYAASAGVSNAALVNLMRQLSLAYGERGVTAHLIAPGPADTERLHRVAEDRARLRGVSFDTVIAEMRAESSLGAFVKPEQVAWAVAMLLAPEADAMTGSTLMLDAGRRKGLP